MTNFFKPAAILVAMTTLAACGGSAEDNFVETGQRFFAIDDRVSAMAPSGRNFVQNTSGTANFSGAALIGYGPRYNTTALVGDANVSVNFNGATSVSGSIRDVSGVADANVDISGTGQLDNYSGVINLRNGSVGSDNTLDVDYSGTLNGNGDTIVMDGTLDGTFRGNPAIRAIDIEDVGLGRVNGNSTYIYVGVVAERD